MRIQQDQLTKLLLDNSQPAWEIEALHSRCCIFFGLESAFEMCNEIISFANMAKLGLLEAFRLHVEVKLLNDYQ